LLAEILNGRPLYIFPSETHFFIALASSFTNLKESILMFACGLSSSNEALTAMSVHSTGGFTGAPLRLNE